jgi:putative sigma-54 modulation protein
MEGGCFHVPPGFGDTPVVPVCDRKGEGMNIEISGRHFDLTDALRTHINEKVSVIEKYYDGIDDVHVILEFTAGLNHAHVQVRGDRLRLDSRSKSHDMYFALDECVHNLERQMRKFKDRHHGHPHRNNHGNGNLTTYYIPVEDSGIEAALRIDEDTELPRFTTNGAMTEFEVGGGDYMIFYNTETDSVSAVYRTSSGSSQVVELTQAGT